MTDIEQLERAVKEHEGFREHPYQDTRKLWTVGYGRCLETHPLTAEEFRYLLNQSLLAISLTEDGAEWLMFRELNTCESACENTFGFWNTLNAARKNVLVEMAFQMGLAKLCKFTQMIAHLQAGDHEQAAVEGLDSVWAMQTPARAEKLMTQLKTGQFA
jgi:lysozyme